jgi:DNA-binding LacI/PurR family transcriptional regulator
MYPIALGLTAAGVRIPEELSLATFWGEPLVDFTTGMHFTTWLVPEYEVGVASVEILMQKIDCRDATIGPMAVPFTKSTNFTTAPPPIHP